MLKTPEIRGPRDSGDFHDSSLIDFLTGPHLDTIEIVVSTPDELSVPHLWLVRFTGVLRLEFETLGDGTTVHPEIPLGIYDIYELHDAERERWIERLKLLRECDGATGWATVHHVVLASSSARGWGEREHLEGIHIVCQNVTIRPAPPKYRGREYVQPTIEGNR